jgi:nucleoside-diphosphate-sugar epimerase
MVVGGSGFIGGNLVRLLSEKNESVVSIYHKRLPEPLPNVYPVCSDLDSVDLLAAPLRGVETVYFLAWQKTFLGSKDDIAFDVKVENCSPNLRMLKNLITAMEIAGTRRLVFQSAIGAGRGAKTAFLKEKYLGEFAVLNSSIAEKVIVRSSLVCGRESERDPFIQSIRNVMTFPGLYPVPNHKDTLAPVHIDDLAEILYQLSSCDITGQSSILEVTGEENLKIEDIFRMVSDRFAKGARFQVRGPLGDTLLPVFERKSKDTNVIRPRLRDYLALGNRIDSHTRTDNPLTEILPSHFKSLRESLDKGAPASRQPRRPQGDS